MWLMDKELPFASTLKHCTLIGNFQVLVAYGKTLIIPAGGSVVWLKDAGDSAKVQAVHEPRNTTLGLSIGEDGMVYR